MAHYKATQLGGEWPYRRYPARFFLDVSVIIAPMLYEISVLFSKNKNPTTIPWQLWPWYISDASPQVTRSIWNIMTISFDDESILRAEISSISTSGLRRGEEGVSRFVFNCSMHPKSVAHFVSLRCRVRDGRVPNNGLRIFNTFNIFMRNLKFQLENK